MIMVDELTKQKKVGEKEIEIKRLDMDIVDLKITIMNHEKAIQQTQDRILSCEKQIEEKNIELEEFKSSTVIKKMGEGNKW